MGTTRSEDTPLPLRYFHSPLSAHFSRRAKSERKYKIFFLHFFEWKLNPPPVFTVARLCPCATIDVLVLVIFYSVYSRLFTPEKVRRKTEDTEDVCPHKEPCLKYILKVSLCILIFFSTDFKNYKIICSTHVYFLMNFQ